MIKLYDSALSGNCHKVRMMLGFLGQPCDKIAMNWAKGDQRLDWFRAVNPRCQLPAIDDDGTVVWDSQAILVYLARKHLSEQWLPLDARALTQVVQWLMLANEEIAALAWARVTVLMKQPRDRLAELQQKGIAGLAVLEGRLREHEWVAAAHPTVGDIACFPYVGLAPQGEVSLDPFPAVRGWIALIKSLPGYVSMPGLE